MSMNFVTFNQDYSHLAVGKLPGAAAEEDSILSESFRYLQRLQNLHDRSILKML